MGNGNRVPSKRATKSKPKPTRQSSKSREIFQRAAPLTREEWLSDHPPGIQIDLEQISGYSRPTGWRSWGLHVYVHHVHDKGGHLIEREIDLQRSPIDAEELVAERGSVGNAELPIDPWVERDAGSAVAMLDAGMLLEFDRWAVAFWIREHRQAIEGDGFMLLLAVAGLASHAVPMPTWLAANYLSRLARVTELAVSSLDQAFGLPPKIARNIEQARQRLELADRVAMKVMFRPVSKSTWEEIGDELGISHEKVRQLYRLGIAEHGRIDWARTKAAKKKVG